MVTFFNRVRFVPPAGGPAHLTLGVEVEPMRAKDAVEKHQKKADVCKQGRTAPAAAWHRGRGSAMDDVAVDSDVGAEAVSEAGVPLTGHCVAVV